MGERDNCALGSLEARMSALEQRVDRQERVDRLEDAVKGIYERLGRLEGHLEEGLRGLKTAMTIGFTLTGCALGGIAAILAAILYVLMTG